MLAIDFTTQSMLLITPFTRARSDEYHEKSAIRGSYFDTLERSQETR